MSALSVKNVSKVYPPRPGGQPIKALDNVSLEVREGSIHGLLGPNGAGKSTLISLLSGISRITEGSIEIFGVDVEKNTNDAKQLLGIVPQEMVVEFAFTVEEVLYYFSGMYGVPASERKERIAQALADLDLTDKAKEKAKNLSGGMKRRLMVAKAILHRPKLVVLDEPTAGVDVALRQKMWELVRRLNREGSTILFTTHYLEEAEQLCESITLVNNGKILTSGPLKDLQEGFTQREIRFELYDPNAAPLAGVERKGSEFVLPVHDLVRDMQSVTEHYRDNLKHVTSGAASLEQIFLEMTK